MATSTTAIKRTITLVLTDDEADFLQDLLQNPVPDTGDEPMRERNIREAIWTALRDSPLA